MPEITFTCSEEDAAWLAEQAEQLGIDDVGITVRVVVRNARQRNQSFGIVANGEHYPLPRAALAAIPYRELPATEQSEPPSVPDAISDEIEAALAEATETAHEPMAARVAVPQPTPVAMAQPSSSYRSRAATLRNQPALRVLDGPGSRTQVVGAGELLSADPRTLPADQRIVAQNLRGQMDRHFGNLRRT
jgi:hypothetical protein